VLIDREGTRPGADDARVSELVGKYCIRRLGRLMDTDSTAKADAQQLVSQTG
jgi:hypothetical protein